MATYYFDSVLGNDTTGDGSLALPWAQYDNKYGSLVDGDRCFFKRGTVQSIATQFRAPRNGASAAAPFYMGAYGEGARPIFRYTGTVWGYIINFANRRWVTVEDLDWDAQGLAQGTIYVAGQTTGTCGTIRFRRCDFYGSLDRHGISVAKEAAATTATVSDIVFENCRAYNNGGHGFYVSAATAVRFKKCVAYQNGAAAVDGGHGFTARWNRTDVTSGWTVVSGNVYKRTLTAPEAAGSVDYMQSTPYAKVTKNTGTPTTPGAGEFGVSAGELYVNIGVNPSGVAIRYAWGRCGDIGFIDCASYDNVANVAAPYLEGHGFAFDDFTEDSFAERCISYGNDGAGFSLNRGDDNQVRNCIAYGNGSNAVACNTASGISLLGSTFAKNNVGSAYLPAGTASEVSFSAYANSGTIENCCIVAKDGGNTYGVNVDPAATGWTVDHCNITGFTTAVRTVTPTNVVAGDPLLTPAAPVP